MKNKKLFGIFSITSLASFLVGATFFFYVQSLELENVSNNSLYESISAWVAFLLILVFVVSTTLYFFGTKIISVWNFLSPLRNKIAGIEHKKKIKLLFFSSIFCFLILLGMIWLNIKYDIFSIVPILYDLSEPVLEPLFFYSITLILLSSILYFLREGVFRSWLRFTKWYLSFAALAIILSLGSHGGWGVGNIFDTELVIMFSAGFFFIISLVLIVYKSYRLRREK